MFGSTTSFPAQRLKWTHLSDSSASALPHRVLKQTDHVQAPGDIQTSCDWTKPARAFC